MPNLHVLPFITHFYFWIPTPGTRRLASGALVEIPHSAVGVPLPPYLLRHATLPRAPHHMTVDRRHAPTAAVLAARRTTNTLRTAAGGARCRGTIAPMRHGVMVTMRRRHAVNVMDTASDSTGRRIG